MARKRKDMDTLQEIIRMHRLGRSARQIAKLSKSSRNTVKKYLACFEEAGVLKGDAHDLPSCRALKVIVDAKHPKNRPAQQQSSLARYRGEIETALKSTRSPTAIHDLLRTKHPEDYRGSLSAVKRVVGALREPQASDVAIPVVHVPGDVLQVDFGSVGRLYDEEGVLRKAYVFVAVLGYSRAMYADVVFSQDVKTWLRLHIATFEAFYGVPKTLVPDNLKSAVIRHAFSVDDDHDINKSYLELARHYGCVIDPTPPRSPEKKGKVESGVKYVKSNFFTPRDFANIDDCRKQLKTWLQLIANARKHGTTHRRPVDMLRQEVKTLKRLPAMAYELVWWGKATVRRNAHIINDRRQYSVPWGLIGQVVDLRINDTEVIIYHAHERVAQHRHPEVGEVATNEAHLPQHRVAQRHRSLEYWQERADNSGPAVRQYVDNICQSDPAVSQTRRVIKALTLLGTLPPDRQKSVCQHACHFGSTKYGALKTIIDDELDISPGPNEPVELQAGGARRFARTAADFMMAAMQKGATHGYN